MEGDSAAEVEGLFSNTGECSSFETKKDMRIYLYYRKCIISKLAKAKLAKAKLAKAELTKKGGDIKISK